MQIGLSLSLTNVLLSSGADLYGVVGLQPNFVADFDREYFRTVSAITDFSNAITHSAASNATMVDSDGLLKWRPHNLLSYSEQFDQWSISGTATVTSNDATAPDGTLTADKIEYGSSFLDAVWRASSANAGQTLTFAVWVKGTSNTTVRLRIWDTDTGSQYSSNISVTTSWSLISHTATIGSASTASNFSIYNNTTGTTADIYVWGAHAYRSDLGGMVNNPDQSAGFETYVPTTSSAVYLPRRGHHVYNGYDWVNEGLLHESEARTNLLTYSSQFDNATWTKFNATVTANDAVSPDGSATADKLIPTATNTASHYAYATISPSVSTAYNTSIYAKAGGYDILRLDIFDTTADLEGEIRVDLSDGAIISHTGGYLPSVENVGNGWYRISYSRTMAATLGTSFFRVFAFADSLFSSFAGDGTSGIYLWGAQLEAGPTPSSLIVTSGATATRAAETLTIPAANLPWPTPEYIGPELVDTANTAAAWVAQGSNTVSDTVDGVEITYVNNSVGALMPLTASGGLTSDLSSGSVYEVTLEAKVVGGLETATIDVWNGVSINDSKTLTNAFAEYRLFFVDQASGTPRLQFGLLGASEVVTIRNISVREINPLAVSIQMDGRVTYADTDAAVEIRFVRWFADSNNYIISRSSTSSASTGLMIFEQASAGVYDNVSSTNQLTPDILEPFNIASRRGSNFVNGALDGIAATANTTPTSLPDLSAADINLGHFYNGTIRTFRVWSQDITDAGLVEATEPSLVPSLSLTFDGTENSFIVEDWSE